MTKTKTNTPMMGKVTFKLKGLPQDEKDEELFISLDFPVQCPKCRTKGTGIKKDGQDKRKCHQTQRFRCKRCGKRFYLHTSSLFVETTKAVLTGAVEEVITGRSSITEVAKRYQMSTSSLQQFVTALRRILSEKATIVKTLLRKENGKTLQVTGKSRAVYIDETFLHIKGTTYYLIVAVNNQGLPLIWKLAPTRADTIIQGVVEELFTQFGQPYLIITDGNPSYKKALRNTFYRGVHVIHLHKDKRNRIIMRKCMYHLNEHYYLEEMIGVNQDLFTEGGSKLIWQLTKRHKLIRWGIGRGRPRGSKNRQKTGTSSKIRLKKQFDPGSGSSLRRKRGPSNVFQTGRLLEIDVNPLQLELSSFSSDGDGTGALLPSTLFSILYPVFYEFAGQAINTNRIETLFSQFDLYYLARGRRTPLTLSYECFTWLCYRTPSPLFHKLIHHLSHSVSPLVGLKNLGKLLQPVSLPFLSSLEGI
jgi:transposase-like protein